MENRMDSPDQNLSPSRPPKDTGPRLPLSWWGLVSVLAFGLILGIGGLELVRLLARPLALLILAISIASALAPLVEGLARKIPRLMAVILVYAIPLLIFITLLAATIPLITGQTRSLVERMRIWVPEIANWLAQYGFDSQGLRGTLLSEAGQFGMIFFRVPVSLGTAIAQFVLIIFLSIYWLFLTPGIKRFFLSFFPAKDKPFVTSIIANMGNQIGGYLRGAAINGVIIGFSEFLGLLLIGVPYALTLGALAGVMELFPTIGPIISGTVVTLVALSVSPHIALIALIFAIVLQQVEGHVLVPLIMRSQTEVSPLLAIFSVIAGASIGGLLGAVIAIPVASVLSVLVRQVIAPAIRRANGVEIEEV
jgi:putative heme transporter